MQNWFKRMANFAIVKQEKEYPFYKELLFSWNFGSRLCKMICIETKVDFLLAKFFLCPKMISWLICCRGNFMWNKVSGVMHLFSARTLKQLFQFVRKLFFAMPRITLFYHFVVRLNTLQEIRFNHGSSLRDYFIHVLKIDLP